MMESGGFFAARVILDSVGPNGVRLTTMEVDTWKSIVAEFNTHRVFSRNSKSSRAVPANKVMDQVTERPFIPRFRYNQAGMTPGDYLNEMDQCLAAQLWQECRDGIVSIVEQMSRKDGLNIHKQWLNRLMEPYMETTILVTSTEWENFWALRCSPYAQDEIRMTAEAMRAAYDASIPQELDVDDWHLPYIDSTSPALNGYSLDDVRMISAGRCATVSYDNLGQGVDPQKDLERALGLLKNGHMSPFEHQAQAIDRMYDPDDGRSFNVDVNTTIPVVTNTMWSGNLRGWHQSRKCIAGENVYSQ